VGVRNKRGLKPTHHTGHGALEAAALHRRLDVLLLVGLDLHRAVALGDYDVLAVLVHVSHILHDDFF